MSSRLDHLSTPIQRNTGGLNSGATSRRSGILSAEIAFDQLRVNDQIVIRTAHSAYIFLVVDPLRQLGLVVGGVFGNYATEAYLDTAPVTQDNRLRTGLRARFHTGADGMGRRVITSVITELIHRRTGS